MNKSLSKTYDYKQLNILMQHKKGVGKILGLREVYILENRCDSKTYQEIADELGQPVHRVRRIEKKACDKLIEKTGIDFKLKTLEWVFQNT